VNFLQLIESKREGKTLAPEQIPDYQMAAHEMKVNAIINNSFGFGRQNATIAAKNIVG